MPEIVQTIESNTLSLLEAEPGAGKTTRVPPALLRAGRGPVYVLEPRRLAARLAARRVSEELARPLGTLAGYQVRFEKVGGDETKIWYLTEGVLTNRLLSRSTLPRGTTVILDEFHERHLETDLALALLRRLLPGRPDIRVLLMSATLGAEALAAKLGGDVPVLRAPGRTFPVAVHHSPASAEPLHLQVSSALRRVLAETRGHVLVFLPGAAEIRAALRACEPLARQASAALLPLYGDLSPEEQDKAVKNSETRKVICSTNVAESSITIEGVEAVVDSGLARMLSHSPWSGFARLQVTKISRSSCLQRAGRAGRTGPGMVVRLFSQEDFARRPETSEVEIVKADLAQVMVQLAAAGYSIGTMPWLDAPPAAAIAHSRRLLTDLGALTSKGDITRLGRSFATSGVHPRLAALVVKATEYGSGEEACELAARLSDTRLRLPENAHRHCTSDIDVVLATEPSFAVRKTQRHLQRLVHAVRPSSHRDEHGLEKATLHAFADRVARRRGQTLLLAQGGSAQLDRNSCTTSEFLVALEVDDRSDLSSPVVRIASPIEPDWLLDFFPERMEAVEDLRWNRESERVEQIQSLRYCQLTIDESCSRPTDTENAAKMLVEKAQEAGINRWATNPDIVRLLARIGFAAEHESGLANTEDLLSSALRQLALGLVSFEELREGEKNGTLLGILQASVDIRLLDELAPSHVILPSGRRARIDYLPGQPPSVSSRLQDFFGLTKSPVVARGTVPLTLRLLAPNGRPVQVTTDLSSFWKTLYPQVRRELSRRYPRHSWPEAPA